MSLYVDLQVNNDPLTSLGITRTTDNGSRPDDINTYVWTLSQNGHIHHGNLRHRYGDGALKLAAAALHAADQEAR